MARKKKEPNRVDELLDELLEDCSTPEDILGESGLMKQIKKRLVERALAGELKHHLQSSPDDEQPKNSRNGSSKKRCNPTMANWNSRFRETEPAALSRYWFPNINVA